MPRPANFDETQTLDKAVRLFWQKGYCETTAQDLSEQLQLNRSSIYNTFKDKKTLFLRALQHYRQSESAGLLTFLEQQEPDTGSLRQLLEIVVQTGLGKGCLMVNSVAEMGAYDPDVRALALENAQDVVAAFESFIHRGQISGAFAADKDARMLAVALFHSMTGMKITAKVIDDPGFFQKNIDATLLLFQ